MDGIDLLGHIDRLKESFLWAAAKGGRLEECQSLTEIGADVNWVSPEGDTALLAATRNGHVDVVSFLLAHGSNINYTMQGNRETALHLACRRGQEALALMLVESGALMAAQDSARQTPLQLAQNNGHAALAHRLHTLSQRVERRRTQDQFREGNSAQTPRIQHPNIGPQARLPAIRGETHALSTTQAQIQVQQAMAAFDVYDQTGDPSRAARVASAYEPSSDDGSVSEDHPSVEDSSTEEDGNGMEQEELLSEAGSLREDARSVGSFEIPQLGFESSHGSRASARRPPSVPNAQLPRRAAQRRNSRQQLQQSHSVEDFELISDVNNLDLTGQVAMLRKELKKAVKERDVAQAKAEAMNDRCTKTWSELMEVEQSLRRIRKERDAAIQKLSRLEGKQLASMTFAAVESLEQDLRKFLEETTKYKEKLIRDKLDNRSDQNLCVICQEEDKCILILPCRHLCLCQQCSNAPQLKVCPLCRKDIQQTLHVFS